MLKLMFGFQCFHRCREPNVEPKESKAQSDWAKAQPKQRSSGNVLFNR